MRTMRTIRITPSFEAWRQRARSLLAADIAPETILWEDTRSGHGSLFDDFEEEPPAEAAATTIRIPSGFPPLAKLAACHTCTERWSLLYRVAWRLTRGGEHRLLELRTDPDTRKLEDLAAAVRRDRHKMKAFVRFKKAGEIKAEEGSIREQFAAWFEPEHDIVELTAPFFARRFAGMDWSILTPLRCAHWDGESLRFTAGVPRSSAPSEDALDDYWRSYYAHIFNPARLKLQAMQSEMPVKYWRNLPEAPLIAQLTREASLRTAQMLERQGGE